MNHKYSGQGSEDDPFLVEWLDSDPRNPMLFSNGQKWLYVAIESIATFAVAITTSVYSAGPREIIGRFGMSSEVYEFGFSGLCSMIDEMQFSIDWVYSLRARICFGTVDLGAFERDVRSLADAEDEFLD